MKTPKLTVCMIVKNEEELLGKSLVSVKGIADEVIVVDTGSEDDTKRIAEEFGATVYDFEWTNDFSEARNFAKQQAGGDWILQLDADEQVLEESVGTLKKRLMATHAYALNVQILNIIDPNEGYLVHRYPRLYRNVPEIGYMNKIHEQIFYQGGQLEIEDSSIQLLHVGYTQEVVKKKNKSQRNIRLLREELKGNPQNAFMNFNLGNELMAAEEYNKALRAYQIAGKHTHDFSVKTSVVMQQAKVFVKLDQPQRALNLLKKGQEEFKDFTDLWYLEGEVLLRMGREEEAKWAFKECLKMGETPRRYMTNAGVGSLFPLEKLAEIAKENRDFKTALGYLTEITEADKYSFSHVVQVMDILLRMFDKEKVIEFIHETYQTDVKKDLVFKNRLAHHFRFYPEFALLFKEGATGLNTEQQELLDFYLNIGEEEAKEVALRWAKFPHTRHYAMIHYLLTKDVDVRKVLDVDKTCRLITTQLDKMPKKVAKSAEFKKDVYVETLKEAMRLGRYLIVERLLPIHKYFELNVNVDLGDLFSAYHQDDLAVQYYTKYLMENTEDFDLHVKAARHLYGLKMYNEALLFAEKAVNMEVSNFKPLELMLDCCKELREKDLLQQIAEQALEIYPESEYLKKAMQYM